MTLSNLYGHAADAALYSAIFRTIVRQLARFQLITACRAVPLR